MLTNRTRFVSAAIAASLVGLGLSACGGGATTTVTDQSDDHVLRARHRRRRTDGRRQLDDDIHDTGPGSTGGSGGLDFHMGDFNFEPAQTTVAAGSVKVTVDNIGATPHEWVLAKTDLEPLRIADGWQRRRRRGQARQPRRDPRRLARQPQTRRTLKLKPGKYVYFCNIPGPLRRRHVRSLDVTGG